MANVNRPARTVPAMEGDSAIRGSYVKVAKAAAMPGATRKVFSMALMFDKANKEHMKMLGLLRDDAKACLEEQWPDPNNRPQTPIVANKSHLGPRCMIKDGDVAVNQKGYPLKKENPEYAGHYVVIPTSSEDSPPYVCGPNREAINPASCKSGYWYKVNIAVYSYTGGSGGVTCGLNGVQLIRRDEVLGGGAPPPDSMFAPVGPAMEQYGGGADDDMLGDHGGSEDWLGGDSTPPPGDTDTPF